MHMSIKDNLERVRERIRRAAERAGRSPDEITVVAVTKTHGPDVVEEAIRAGITDIGENRMQEFLRKSAEVELDCRWHLVGHLQTNKVNKAIGRFALIHSVDSVRLAEKISAAGEREGITTDVLCEVNTSGEESKYGLGAEEAVDLCGRIAVLPHIRLRGLMTVGPWVDDQSVIAASFAALRRLRERIEHESDGDISLEHLSMGMTDDFEIAIAEGSTIIRLGRVLFGEREAY
jgi:pyridoxal phosphate enzyme (YggS family)